MINLCFIKHREQAYHMPQILSELSDIVGKVRCNETYITVSNCVNSPLRMLSHGIFPYRIWNVIQKG